MGACMPMPHLRATIFLAALLRRPLESHELATIARLPYWLGHTTN